MGNGESTARRISMQRSDEGVVQISEDVMLMLRGKQVPKIQPIEEAVLAPGEAIIHEDELKHMMRQAFEEGRKRELSVLEKERQEWQRSREKQQLETREMQEEWKRDLSAVEKEIDEMHMAHEKQQQEVKEQQEAWRISLEERDATIEQVKTEKQAALDEQITQSEESRKVLSTELDGLSQKVQELEASLLAEKEVQEKQSAAIDDANLLIAEKDKQVLELSAAVDEFTSSVALEREEQAAKASLLEEAKQVLEQELTNTENKVLELEAAVAAEQERLKKEAEERGTVLKDRFNKGVAHIDSMLVPLRQDGPICIASQTKVLECYRANKNHALRCSPEVKEFVSCVETARLKKLHTKAMKETGVGGI